MYNIQSKQIELRTPYFGITLGVFRKHILFAMLIEEVTSVG